MKETKLSPALFWIIGFPFAALWASASVASKIGLTAAQPFTISFIRFSGAGLLMLVISHVFMQKQLPKGRQWKQLAVYGLLNISLYLGLFIYNNFLRHSTLLFVTFKRLQLYWPLTPVDVIHNCYTHSEYTRDYNINFSALPFHG